MCFPKIFPKLIFLIFGCTVFVNQAFSFTNSDFKNYFVNKKTILDAYTPKKIIIKDVSNDGFDDLIFLDEKSGGIVVMFSKSNSKREFEDPVLLGNSNGMDFDVVDLNNDNLNDIVCTSELGISVYYQSNVKWNFNYVLIGGLRNDLINIKDVNDDGNLDIIFVDKIYNKHSLYISYQNNLNTFTTTKYKIGNLGEIIANVDVYYPNNNDNPMLLIGYKYHIGNKFVGLYEFNGDKLSQRDFYDTNSENEINFFKCFDIDNDGQQELVYLNNSNAISILSIDDDKNLNFSEIISKLEGCESIVDIDLNFDNKKELVVLHRLTDNFQLSIISCDIDVYNEEILEQTLKKDNSLSSSAIGFGDVSNNNNLDLYWSSDSDLFSFYAKSQEFLLPHIANTDGWETMLVARNVSDEFSNTLLQRYSNGFAIGNVQIYCNPGETQYYKLEKGDWGTVRINGGKTIVSVVYKNNNENGLGTAEFKLDEYAGRKLYFALPQYNSDNLTWMGIAFANITNNENIVNLDLYDEKGLLVENKEVTVGGFERFSSVLKDLFFSSNLKNSSKIVLTSEYPVVGINISGFENEKLLFVPAVTKFEQNVLYVPHIAYENESWKTKFIFDNFSSSKGSAVITYYDENGLEINNENLDIDGFTTKILDIKDFSGLYSYSAKINLNGSIVARESFLNIEENGKGTAEFILKNNYSNQMIYSFPNENFDVTWKGIAYNNVTSSVKDFEIYIYQNDGDVLLLERTLQPHQRDVFMISDVLRKDSGLDFKNITSIKIVSDSISSGLSISGYNNSRLLFGYGVGK